MSFPKCDDPSCCDPPSSKIMAVSPWVWAANTKPNESIPGRYQTYLEMKTCKAVVPQSETLSSAKFCPSAKEHPMCQSCENTVFHTKASPDCHTLICHDASQTLAHQKESYHIYTSEDCGLYFPTYYQLKKDKKPRVIHASGADQLLQLLSSRRISLIGLFLVDTGALMLRNCFIDYAVEHRFGCCTTEPGIARDIGALEI